MRKIFENYGGVITTAMAIVALVGVIALLFTGNGNGWMEQPLHTLTTNFTDEINVGLLDSVEMLDGDGTVYNKTAPTLLSFRSPAEYDDFVRVEVDGKTVAGSNYVVTEGSTIVTFNEDYSNNLKDGEHKVKIISKDEVAQATFSVTSTDTSALNPSGTIPEGATYTIKSTGEILEAGDKFPETTNIIDVYTYGDYKYSYTASVENGWEVQINTSVTDKNQTSYSELLESINGLPVTNISNTFRNCTALTKAPVIPNSVVKMYGTFSRCTSLTEAPIIPSSVTDMQDTFIDCNMLNKAPDMSNATSVTNMAATFRNCTALTKAPVIPNSVTNMTSTFTGCSNLVEAPIIPNSVIHMVGTFSYCTSLTKAPDMSNASNVKNMSQTFYKCSALKEAPDLSKTQSLTGMDNMFWGCSALSEAPVIPNSVTDMSFAFRSCTSLTKAPAIPNSVTNMRATFNGCTNLVDASITIPSNVTDIAFIFNDCILLTGSITVNATPTSYQSCLTNTQITEILGDCTIKDKLLATK